MQSHESNIDLIESACSALWSLSMEGTVRMVIIVELGFRPLRRDSLI